MKIIELIPRVGIHGIPFGSSRAHVRLTMELKYGGGEPSPRSSQTDCYFENSLQFSFEDDDTLSFIEVASPPPVYAVILGIRTWEIDGAELLSALSKVDVVRNEISEGGASPIFRKTWIGLWDLNNQYDHVGAQDKEKWGAIGIGDRRYYESICKIHGVDSGLE